LIYAKL